MGKPRTTKCPVALYEATLAVSEASGLTMVCDATPAAEVLACAGFFEAQPAANIPVSTNASSVNDFMAIVKRVMLRRSIHDSAMIASSFSLAGVRNHHGTSA
jgi:hypothetical protein